MNEQVILATPDDAHRAPPRPSLRLERGDDRRGARGRSAILGRELYGRLGKLTEHFAKVGRGLDSAVRSYNESVGSLETRVCRGRKFRTTEARPRPQTDRRRSCELREPPRTRLDAA